jgi:hypothetical protein
MESLISLELRITSGGDECVEESALSILEGEEEFEESTFWLCGSRKRSILISQKESN